MNDYDKNKESSYLKYWYVNNLYDWSMSQKRLVNNFEQKENTPQFNADFIKNYYEENVECPEELLLPEIMKIKKFEKLVTILQNKTEYVIHIRNLKQALNHGIIWKNVHRVIKFNQKAWQKASFLQAF